jgi:hypothetical protein
MCWGIMGFILYMNCYVLGNHGIHSVLFLPVGESWDSFYIGIILYYAAINCRSGDIGNTYSVLYMNYSVLFLPVGIPCVICS